MHVADASTFQARRAMSDLHAGVIDELRRHGLERGPDETREALRERLNDLYLAAIRALKGRLAAGDFPMADYRERVQQLKESFPLLGLPLDRWGR